MKKTKKKLKHYVIRVKMRQEFDTLKDIDAYNEDEAIKEAKTYAAKEFNSSRERRENWSDSGDAEFIGTEIEDEYEV